MSWVSQSCLSIEGLKRGQPCMLSAHLGRRQEIWEQVGLGAQDDEELSAHHEQAVTHFDNAETHFTGEVAARSSHFFEAAGVVADLRASLEGSFDLVHGMRQEVSQHAAEKRGAARKMDVHAVLALAE